MRKLFSILISLFLLLLCFGCVKNNSPEQLSDVILSQQKEKLDTYLTNNFPEFELVDCYLAGSLNTITDLLSGIYKNGTEEFMFCYYGQTDTFYSDFYLRQIEKRIEEEIMDDYDLTYSSILTIIDHYVEIDHHKISEIINSQQKAEIEYIDIIAPFQVTIYPLCNDEVENLYQNIINGTDQYRVRVFIIVEDIEKVETTINPTDFNQKYPGIDLEITSTNNKINYLLEVENNQLEFIRGLVNESGEISWEVLISKTIN